MENFIMTSTDCNIVAPNGAISYNKPQLLITEDFVLALAMDKNNVVLDYIIVSGKYKEGLHGLLKYGLSIQSWETLYDEEGDVMNIEYFTLHP